MAFGIFGGVVRVPKTPNFFWKKSKSKILPFLPI